MDPAFDFDPGRSGQQNQDLAAGNGDRPRFREVFDGDGRAHPIPTRHDVQIARRPRRETARGPARTVEAERLKPSQDLLDRVDDQIHPLALEEGNGSVDPGKG